MMTADYTKRASKLIMIWIGLILINIAIVQNVHSQATAGEKYTQKVDNFIVIIDASGSGSEAIYGEKKLDIAKNIANLMNRVIPDILRLTSIIRTYGKGEKLSSKIKTERIYGPAKYSKEEFENALQSITSASGLTFMAYAIEAASQDMESLKGKSALILLSDGKVHTNDPIEAARKIKARYGDNLWIYTVFIPSDTADINQVAKDKALMNQIASVGGGYSVSAEDIATRQGMKDFIKDIFLVPISDSDSDGVDDTQDICPDTPKNVAVNEKGCWIIKNLLFDFNQSDIDPQYYPNLDNAVNVLQEYPDLKIEIQGHTDNIGTDTYNQKLSEQRASAVMNYFLKKGIQKERLSSKGYGFTKPIAPNDTLEDRAKNRRVELHPIQ